MAKKAGLVWIDAQGEKVLHVITTDTGVGAIETALEAKSNAGVVECWEGLDELSSPTPTAATYPTVRATVVLTFTDGVGSFAKLFIPAPVSSIFAADGVSVDPTQIAGIIAAAVGHLVCGSGNVATAYVGGQLLGTRFNAISSVV